MHLDCIRCDIPINIRLKLKEPSFDKPLENTNYTEHAQTYI